MNNLELLEIILKRVQEAIGAGGTLDDKTKNYLIELLRLLSPKQTPPLTTSDSNYVLLKDSVSYNYIKIPANGVAYYKVVIGPNDTGRKITVTIGSCDYTTKQEMIIGKNIPVTETNYTEIVNKGLPQYSTAGKDGLWYYITAGTSYLSRAHTILNITAGNVYYILIKNVSKQTGTYSISYNLRT